MTARPGIVALLPRSLWKRHRLIAVLLALLWGAGWLARPPLLETAAYSREVFDRDGRLLRITLSGDEKYRRFTPLEKMPAGLIRAVLAQEDRFFYYHPGINPVSLARAVSSTYITARKRLGASTITMQLARMTSTRGSKTVSGKLAQMAGALWIETWHTKDEILEAYLNLLPFGANIEGVGAASRILFTKDLKRLSVDEIGRMVAIPQNPTAHNREAVAAIRRLPFAAPHFVQLALARSQARPAPELHLTLSREVQTLAERKLKSHVATHQQFGIRNGAVMVLNHETMEVLALSGSANFFDDAIGGQINGALAARSPGSTVKPFVYALAIDQGLIHPLSLLKDSPAAFGAFDPENFDHKFFGPLPAAEALVHSRNVPAVYLASRLKTPTLYDFLRAAGVTLPKPAEHYGLALSLGGAEIAMEDLVRLYAMLANGGDLHEPRYFKGEKMSPARGLLSGEAAHLTLSMLRQNPRSNQRAFETWLRDAVPTAWKTGTSNGFRDAWTIGLAGPFVVAVWLGNFDNEGNPALIGRDLAAPLFFSIADGLRPLIREPPRWPSVAGLNLKKVKVCAVSGDLPGRHCHVTRETGFIPGKSPIDECGIHREILVSRVTGERACDDRQPGLKKEVHEFWPSDILQLFRAAGLARRQPPPFARHCRIQDIGHAGVAPSIVSPRKDVVYSLRVVTGRDGGSEERIALSAVADGDVRTLHWFIGTKYLGRTDPQKPLFWRPEAGRHVVRVADDVGRSDARAVEVRVTR